MINTKKARQLVELLTALALDDHPMRVTWDGTTRMVEIHMPERAWLVHIGNAPALDSAIEQLTAVLIEGKQCSD